MQTTMFGSSSIPVLEQVLRFTQSRHEILAGNVANIDTPGYRTRDLSVSEFQGQLREALEADRRGRATSAGSPGAASLSAVEAVGENLHGILRHDDSNVGVEQQVAELTKNHMQHNLALSILTSQFRLLQAAIGERA